MRKSLIISILVTGSTFAFGQKAAKKPLDHSVYDTWQEVANQHISDDGKWVAYVIKPQQADASLVITDARSRDKMLVPRADTVRLTSDSKFAVFLIRPFYKDTRMARIKKKSPEDFPKDTLGLVTLGSRQLIKVPSVKSFKVADKAAVIAYLANVPPDTAKKTSLKFSMGMYSTFARQIAIFRPAL